MSYDNGNHYPPPPLTDPTPNRTVIAVHRQLANQFQPASKQVADAGVKFLKTMNALATASQDYSNSLVQLANSSKGAMPETERTGDELKKLAMALHIFNEKHKSNIQLFTEIVNKTNHYSQQEKEKLKEMYGKYAKQEKDLQKSVQKNLKPRQDLEQFYATEMNKAIGNQQSRYKFFVDKHAAWIGAYVELCKQMRDIIPLHQETNNTLNRDRQIMHNGTMENHSRPNNDRRSTSASEEISVESLPHSPIMHHRENNVDEDVELVANVELIVHQPRTHSFANSSVHQQQQQQRRDSRILLVDGHQHGQVLIPQMATAHNTHQQHQRTEDAIARLSHFTPPNASYNNPQNHTPASMMTISNDRSQNPQNHTPVSMMSNDRSQNQLQSTTLSKPVEYQMPPPPADHGISASHRPPANPKSQNYQYQPRPIELFEEPAPPIITVTQPEPTVPIAPVNPKDYGRRLIATHDYRATAGNQLSLAKGDRLILLKKGFNGWEFGKLVTTHHTGWFPASYAIDDREETISTQRM